MKYKKRAYRDWFLSDDGSTLLINTKQVKVLPTERLFNNYKEVPKAALTAIEEVEVGRVNVEWLLTQAGFRVDSIGKAEESEEV